MHTRFCVQPTLKDKPLAALPERFSHLFSLPVRRLVSVDSTANCGPLQALIATPEVRQVFSVYISHDSSAFHRYGSVFYRYVPKDSPVLQIIFRS